MNIGRDNRKVLASIKDGSGPASFQKIMTDTDLSHKRVQASLQHLHETGGISSGGAGSWVAIRKRPTRGDVFVGLFLVFAFGVGCGYAWHYMAVS